jgi:hypothetical protein
MLPYGLVETYQPVTPKPPMTIVQSILTSVTLATLGLAAACGATGGDASRPAMPSTLGPVEGRTSTGAGVSFDFPSGWEEVPLHGPYTKSYESDEDQLVLDVSDTPITGQSVTTLGEQALRRLAQAGTVAEKGRTRIDGYEAYRSVVNMKTSTGQGLVYCVTVLRRPDRATTFILSSKKNAESHHRAAIDDLVSDVKIEP